MNARSIQTITKRDELELLMSRYQYDVVAITESWLTGEFLDSEVNIPGYTMFRKDRGFVRDNVKGGGVLIYVKDCFCAYECDDLNKFKCEAIWINLKLSSKNTVLIGVCYRSPNAVDQEIIELFSAVQTAAKTHAIILGDFNYPGIDWSTLQCEPSSKPFLDLVHDCFLHQHVEKPTRDKHILDMVFSTESKMVEE